MIRKVNIEQLRPGIYIHDFGTKWMDHPYFSNKHKLASSWDLDRIREYGITEIYIDTTRGLDVLPERVPVNAWTKAFENKKAEAKLLLKKLPWAPIEQEINQALEIQQAALAYIKEQAQSLKSSATLDYDGAFPIADRIVKSLIRNHNALFCLISMRSSLPYNLLHPFHVAILSAAFCRKLGFEMEQVLLFTVGGLLYDLGMHCLPESLLQEETVFGEQEKQQVQNHPALLSKILSSIKNIDSEIINMASQHHERLDGSGYPGAITDEEISLGGRLTAITDVYAAKITERKYQPSMPGYEVMKYLFQKATKQFDQELLKIFLQTVGVYPVGSLVRLKSGFLAVVIATAIENVQNPSVMIIFDIRKKRIVSPRKLDLNEGVGELHQIEGIESNRTWDLDLVHLIKNNEVKKNV